MQVHKMHSTDTVHLLVLIHDNHFASSDALSMIKEAAVRFAVLSK